MSVIHAEHIFTSKIIENGDIVVLKSGGPPMMVVNVRDGLVFTIRHGDDIICAEQWKSSILAIAIKWYTFISEEQLNG